MEENYAAAILNILQAKKCLREEEKKQGSESGRGMVRALGGARYGRNELRLGIGMGAVPLPPPPWP